MSRERPQSVLLVTIDTLRADRVGAYGDAEARTPQLDALATRGLVFTQAHTPVPLTLPAHASLLTGLIPPAHGVRGNGAFVLSGSTPTLAEALRARGLRTAAFIGGFPLSRRFGLARGFDHYDDAMTRPPGVHYEFAERRGSEVAAAARAWLTENPGPVFVWAHFFDPHAPYDPPADFRGRDPYRGEVAAADAALGDLLASWRLRPEPSLVVVTADHGEAFGEHGEESHSLFVYETTLRVPLVLEGAGVPAGRRVETPVALTDVAATIIGRIGGTSPSLPGHDLTSSVGSPLYAETLAPRLDFGWSELRSIRQDHYKYVRAPKPELYDLAADPGETRNRFADEPEVAARLTRVLDRTLAETGETESRAPLDLDSAERLRALGYVHGPGGAGSGADPKDQVTLALDIARAAGPFSSHAAAATVYASLLRRDPENPLLNFRLADALLRSGRRQESIPHFRKVLSAGARTADPYVGLATAYAELGRLEDARRILTRALAVEPGNGQVQYNLGEIARVAGDAATARVAYRAALDDPLTHDRAKARLDALK
jgi:choline-sulfatase